MQGGACGHLNLESILAVEQRLTPPTLAIFTTFLNFSEQVAPHIGILDVQLQVRARRKIPCLRYFGSLFCVRSALHLRPSRRHRNLRLLTTPARLPPL